MKLYPQVSKNLIDTIAIYQTISTQGNKLNKLIYFDHLNLDNIKIDNLKQDIKLENIVNKYRFNNYITFSPILDESLSCETNCNKYGEHSNLHKLEDFYSTRLKPRSRKLNIVKLII